MTKLKDALSHTSSKEAKCDSCLNDAKTCKEKCQDAIAHLYKTRKS